METKYESVDKIFYMVNELGYKLLEYEKNKKYVTIQNEDGYICRLSFYALVRNNGGCNFYDESNIYTIDNIVLWLKLNNKSFSLYGKNIYINSKSSLICYCNKCSDYFKTNWSNILNGNNCAVCRGMQVGLYHSLEYLMPDLASEWHTKNDILPNQVGIGSGKKVWWKCKDCGKEWLTRIVERSSGDKTGCPCCSGNELSERNSLAFNYSDIISEWNYEKNENLDINLMTVSSSRKVWWICSNCDHEWVAAISSRTKPGQGCPKCNESKGEKKISDFLYNNNITFIQEFVIPECKHKRVLPFDFYLSDYGILIEYDSILHYKDKFNNPEEFKLTQLRDSIKTQYCLDNNIPLLRIPYWDFDNIEQILSQYLNLQ